MEDHGVGAKLRSRVVPEGASNTQLEEGKAEVHDHFEELGTNTVAWELMMKLATETGRKLARKKL